MFDHVGFGVSDVATSKTFFLRALAPLGVTVVMEGPYGVGLGKRGKPSLWIYQATSTPTPMHLAFTAESRREVESFYQAALWAGGRTTDHRAFGRTITRITTARLSSDRTGTMSRSSATRRRPDHACNRRQPGRGTRGPVACLLSRAGDVPLDQAASDSRSSAKRAQPQRPLRFWLPIKACTTGSWRRDWPGVSALARTAWPSRSFFLVCVIVAGLYGAATASRRILFVQALPAVIGLVLVLLA